MTARTFLISGLLAGLLAGAIAFVVAFTIGEPSVDRAIAVEEAAAAHDHAATDHEHADEPAITREQQSTFGLATATGVLGTVFGGIAGIVAALLTGRIGRLTAPAAGVLAAGLGFLTLALTPFLVYPPNPPAVGNPDTIGQRTATYFTLVAVALVAAVVAMLIVRALMPHSLWSAAVTGGGVYLLAIGVAVLVLPGINEAPDSFPATTLYEFRIGSLVIQSTLWLTIGIALSGLLSRRWAKEKTVIARREFAASL